MSINTGHDGRITKVMDGIEESLSVLDRSKLMDSTQYLSFKIFYAPHGIQFPEEMYEPGWYCQISDVIPDEDAEFGYIWVTGDPMGPEKTAADAAALAQTEWSWPTNVLKDRLKDTPAEIEMEWC